MCKNSSASQRSASESSEIGGSSDKFVMHFMSINLISNYNKRFLCFIFLGHSMCNILRSRLKVWHLCRVSSIESKSSHPMAYALVDHARSYSIEPKPESVKEFRIYPGEGIYGEIEGRNIYIGNKRIAARASSETGKSYVLNHVIP